MKKNEKDERFTDTSASIAGHATLCLALLLC